MPADLLAGVEANQSEDDRSAAVLRLSPVLFLGHIVAEETSTCLIFYATSLPAYKHATLQLRCRLIVHHVCAKSASTWHIV